MLRVINRPAPGRASTGDVSLKRHLLATGFAALLLSACGAPEEAGFDETVTAEVAAAADVAAAAAAEEVATADAVAPEERALEAERASQIALGNGMRAPLGVRLDQFKRAHADAECFPFRGATMCELQLATPEDCPSDAHCRSVTYAFRDDRLDGFTATYGEDEWMGLFIRTETALGPAVLTEKPITPPLSMGSGHASWSLEEGKLEFVHFVGVDINGEPLRNPYVIAFQSASR